MIPGKPATRDDPHGELMRFVEFWHQVTGSAPKSLDFDSKVVDRRHNPILREAALGHNSLPVGWLGQRKIEFTFH